MALGTKLVNIAWLTRPPSLPPGPQVEDGTQHGLGKFLGETSSLGTATKLAGTSGSKKSSHYEEQVLYCVFVTGLL